MMSESAAVHQNSTLHALSNDTVSLIGSCQVITSVFSVVKELVENSLDAGASSVDVKLEGYGLVKIEVSDNGSGIKPVDIPYMAKRHYTSKISCTDDLGFLTTYGFRGEALGSLCAVSQVTVTTKTAVDSISHVYTIGGDGDILDKKPSHNGKGTIVTSKNLFHNVPVRKQYFGHSQRKKEDLKKIELLMMVYALVRPELRITLKHEKEQVFQKTALKDIKSCLTLVFGRHVAGQLLRMDKCTEETQVSICAFLPKPGSDVKEMSFANPDKTLVAVNKRPVYVHELNKILRNYYSNCHGLETYRYPVCFVSLDIATNQIDVNVDPNKTKVFFQQKMEIQNALEEMLVEIYGPLENVPSWHYREANGEPKPPKAKGMSANDKEKIVTKPFITYSKRPDDDQPEDKIESSTLSTVTNSCEDLEKDPSDKNKEQTTLPSYSLTFHSEQLDQNDSDLSVRNVVTPELVNCEADNIQANNQCENATHTETVMTFTSTPQTTHIETNSQEEECEVNTNSSTVSDNINQNDNSSKSKISDSQEVSIEKYHTTGVLDDFDDDDLFFSDDLLAGKTSTPADFNFDRVLGLNEIEETFTNALIDKSESSKDVIQEVTLIDNIKDKEVVREVITSDETMKSSDGIQDINKNNPANENLSVSQINSEDWSRGNLLVSNSLIRPVKLLPPTCGQRPGKRPLSPSKEVKEFCSSQPRRKTAKLNLLTNQTTLLDMVASQITNKPESPFSQFYKEKYPSLSKSLPDESDETIEKRLKQVWEDLKDDEKVTYREKCWQDTKRYEKDVKSMSQKYESQNTSRKKVANKKCSEKVKKILKKRLYCKEKRIKIPINSMRNVKPQTESTETIQVVGPAGSQDACWYCSIGDKLYLVNLGRLAEVSLYKKLKSEHKLPFTSCDPIILDSGLINERGVAVLEKLAQGTTATHGIYFQITDERIMSNGFDIKCHYDSSGKLCSELIGISHTVPGYDVKDLNLLLGVLSSNPDVSLSQSRTLKATYYLQSEAVRMSRQNSGSKTSQDVKTLLGNAGDVINKPCIHHKPIFKELIDFSNDQFDD